MDDSGNDMTVILIVYDSKPYRSSLRRFLEKKGHAVIEAENASQAHEICRTRTCGLIITDIMRPDKEGVATVMELQETYPEIRIISWPASGMSIVRKKKSDRVGVQNDDCYNRLFTSDRLLAAIDGFTYNSKACNTA